MRGLIILLLCILTSYSYGQVDKNRIIGKWFLTNFEIDSITVVDKKNPMNVVHQNMHQLKRVRPNYTAVDSIEYVNQIMTRMSSFDNYSIEFSKNGTYRNTKIIRGRVTEEKEEGQFEIVESRQVLVQVDNKQRTTESRIELNSKTLKLFIKVGDKEMIMMFERSSETAH